MLEVITIFVIELLLCNRFSLIVKYVNILHVNIPETCTISRLTTYPMNPKLEGVGTGGYARFVEGSNAI